VVVVDVGSVTDHERIFAALRWLGRSPAQIRCVVPTHLHMDHIIGIDSLAVQLGVPVVLGQVAYEAVTQGRTLRFPRGLHVLRALPTYVMQGAPVGALADWQVGLEFGFPWSKNRFRAPLVPTLETDHSVLGLEGWTVLHTPGHADDAVCFYHEGARFLVADDTVRNFSGGEWNPLGCDRGAYERTKARLRQLDVQTVFPGHGPVIEGDDAIRQLRTLPRFAP
jgi:glyoxylase-like metal-dependent hydrolase (beta-lactamase superfamily II)